jgi:hypothetical protein
MIVTGDLVRLLYWCIWGNSEEQGSRMKHEAHNRRSFEGVEGMKDQVVSAQAQSKQSMMRWLIAGASVDRDSPIHGQTY